MSNGGRISIHEIFARDLRAGDQLSVDGAAGLDHDYHTSDAGQDITVLTVRMRDDLVEVVFSDDYYTVLARPDTQVAVVRPRA